MYTMILSALVITALLLSPVTVLTQIDTPFDRIYGEREFDRFPDAHGAPPVFDPHPDDQYYDDRFFVGGLDMPVYTSIVYNDELYIGGSFLWYNGNVQLDQIARWDGATWQPVGEGFNDGSVYALTVYNSDLIAGGLFWTSGETQVSNIARWDGENWQPMGEGFSGFGYVLALTVYNGDLIAGGYFTQSGSSNVSRIARWDGESWQPMGDGFNQPVYTLSVYNDELIAGGRFTQSGSTTINRIARWDGENWQPMGEGFNDRVIALTLFDGDLIAGGVFTQSGGTSVNRIARWENDSWHQIGNGFDLGVSVLTVYNGDLIAGGGLTQNVGPIARWDGDEWLSMGFESDITPLLYTLIFFNGKLIAGGSHYRIQDDIFYIASYNDSEWSAMGVREYGLGINVEGALALHSDNNYLYTGGNITLIGDTPVNRIARFDGDNWEPIGEGFNGNVEALIIYNGDLIAGGQFTQSGETTVNYIARWDGENWQPMGDGFSHRVMSFTIYNGELIAGGAFTSSGSTSLGRVARWDGESWHPVGEGFSSNGVNALTVYDDYLIAGGNFTSTGNWLTTNRIARWDGESWQRMGGSPTFGFSHDVLTLTVYNGELIAGGSFDVSGGKFVNGTARWDGENWQQIGEGLGWVYSYTVYNDELIAGGQFILSGDTFVNGIARWDGESWYPVGSGISAGQVVPSVRALSVFQEDLYLGGTFHTAGGKASRSIAMWSGLPVGVSAIHTEIPRQYTLYQNYPNPFNPTTTIRYALPDRSSVKLEIFNTLGQRVATLVDAEQEAGYHEVTFDASRLASGVYIYNLTAGEYVESKKLLFLK